MKKLIALSLILLGFATACTTSKATVSRVSFPEPEYAQLNPSGNAVIQAKVFLETKDGEILTKAGNKVILNPVTSYSSQWYDTARRKQPLENPDSRLMKHVREGITDEKGHVTFKNIPAGEYFLVTPLVWDDLLLDSSDVSTTIRGRFVVQRINVMEGDSLSVSLNMRSNQYEDTIKLTTLNNGNMPQWSTRLY